MYLLRKFKNINSNFMYIYCIDLPYFRKEIYPEYKATRKEKEQVFHYTYYECESILKDNNLNAIKINNPITNTSFFIDYFKELIYLKLPNIQMILIILLRLQQLLN